MIIDFQMIKIAKLEQKFYPVNCLIKAGSFLRESPHRRKFVHFGLKSRKNILFSAAYPSSIFTVLWLLILLRPSAKS